MVQDCEISSIPRLKDLGPSPSLATERDSSGELRPLRRLLMITSIIVRMMVIITIMIILAIHDNSNIDDNNHHNNSFCPKSTCSYHVITQIQPC